MAKVYKNPHTVTYDSAGTPVAVTGCTAINIADSAAPNTTMCDDGTVVHWVGQGSVSGTITFVDHVQAALIANKTVAAKLMTFLVLDEIEATKTVTITNIKTGGIQDTYALSGASTSSVSFVADSISSPA